MKLVATPKNRNRNNSRVLVQSFGSLYPSNIGACGTFVLKTGSTTMCGKYNCEITYTALEFESSVRQWLRRKSLAEIVELMTR